MKTVTLNDGVVMPVAGYGVFQIADPQECSRCVIDAIQTGYRLIDTAAAYMNEAAVGQGIKHSGVAREQLFVTSKLWVQDTGYERTQKAIDASLRPPDPRDYPGMLPEMAHPGSLVFMPPECPVDVHGPPVWWKFVFGACWKRPLGYGSGIEGLENRERKADFEVHHGVRFRGHLHEDRRSTANRILIWGSPWRELSSCRARQTCACG